MVGKLILFTMSLCTASAFALDVPATVTALRLRASITGGALPVTDPLFTQMVTRIQGGDSYGAAVLAASSKYFANHLARRLALQMQTPSLDSTGITDSDATAFLIAHFIGAGTPPRLSTIWSENATYLPINSKGVAVHAADLTADDLATMDWSRMVRTPGQKDGLDQFIPVQHVGGYTTLSDRATDNSFAIFAATAGTNLRFIEGIWEIATGLGLLDVASDNATPEQVPRFVPEFDPNFFHGQGQMACISCHGGGMSSLDHGYATVANIFDVTGDGFVFIPNPTTGTMKSLGSNPGARNQVKTCNLSRTPTPVCNPESLDVSPTQGWDVAKVWEASGALKAMGWQGQRNGNGLQELGYTIAKSWIVYQFFTQRVIAEMCPLGNFSSNEINQIAAAANPWADPAGSDDLRTIVAKVAVSPGCL